MKKRTHVKRKVHHALAHAHTRIALMLALVLGLGLASMLGDFSARAPIASSETRFVEHSTQGLQIVPASCPSNPHYLGECNGTDPQCPVPGQIYNPATNLCYTPTNTCPAGQERGADGFCHVFVATCTLTASPASVQSGQESTLTLNSTYAQTCNVYGDGGYFNLSGTTVGTYWSGSTGPLTQPYNNFGAVCSRNGIQGPHCGVVVSAGNTSCPAGQTLVNGVCVPDSGGANCTLYPDSASVQRGGSTMLHLRAPGAESCNIYGGQYTTPTSPYTTVNVASWDYSSGAITNPTSFGAICTRNGVQGTACNTQVNPNDCQGGTMINGVCVSSQLSCTLSASPAYVSLSGGNTTLTLTSNNADSCALIGGRFGGGAGYPIGTGGSVSTGPIASATSYQGVCTKTGIAGGAYCGVVINVGDCPVGQILRGGVCVSQCTPGYYCDGNTLKYKNSDCTNNAASEQRCTYRCSGNACVLNPGPEVVQWKVAPALLRSGASATVTWEVKNVSSCSVQGNNAGTNNGNDYWTGASGEKRTSPITHQSTYTLSCEPLPNSNADPITLTATINIAPVVHETGGQ